MMLRRARANRSRWIPGNNSPRGVIVIKFALGFSTLMKYVACNPRTRVIS